MRIRQWAKAGVVLITPALKWVKGRYAQNYHCFLKQTENQDLIRLRKTAIEPIFDLIAKLIDVTDNHKQIALQTLQNVRTYLTLAVFTLQLAMIMNSVWGLPIRAIAHFQGGLALIYAHPSYNLGPVTVPVKKLTLLYRS